jgi:mannose-6-phosphate isomerase-like protein (cupin superfamily)
VDAWELADLVRDWGRNDRPYLEFLRVPSLSVGVYQLPAGGVDPQLPHTEDEVYYVAGGRGAIRVDGEDRAVQTGSVIFVAAGVEHRFHSIVEDLTILVFFAPAEYARAAAAREER